jgi:hypothetical protein
MAVPYTSRIGVEAMNTALTLLMKTVLKPFQKIYRNFAKTVIELYYVQHLDKSEEEFDKVAEIVYHNIGHAKLR